MKYIYNKLALWGVVLCFFSACSSPESDGKKAAEKFCDCDKEFTENLGKETQNFISNFADFGFQTRVEAREKSEELIEKASRKYESCVQKAQQEYSKLKGKYVGNYEKVTKFEYAYNSKREFDEQEMRHGVSNQMEINNLILTVIPPKPNTENIKRDLIGRKITPQPKSYYSQSWFWEIKEGDIREIEIVSDKKQGDTYLFGVRLILQSDGGAHEAFVNLTYALRQNDDWTIEFLENKSVSFVKTGKYDNCVTIEQKSDGGIYERYLQFTNHCDVTLVVGGTVLPEQRGRNWEIFSTRVEPNSTSRIGGLFSVSVGDYQIHFIERP